MTAIPKSIFPTITGRWPRFVPTPKQFKLIRCQSRFKVVPAGRRSGKTELAKVTLATIALNPWDPALGRYQVRHSMDPNYFCAAPTRDQAKRIYWEDMKKLIPAWALKKKPSESELKIELLTGVTIWIVGLDKPERIEGAPWDGGILDEYGNMRETAWKANVRPALSDRNGWCWLIGVPEGRNHYYHLYKKAIARESVSSEWAAHTWFSSDVLPASEIQAAKEDLDPLTYEQEFEASFVSFEGRAYYNFTDFNVFRGLRLLYDPRLPLIVCLDFNTAPGVAAIIQELRVPPQDFSANPVTCVIGEVYVPVNSNTEIVTKKVIKDWQNHQGEVWFYGDATGGAVKSSSLSGSDWDIVRDVIKGSPFHDKTRFKYKASNPSERSRVNAVNSRTMSVTGEIRLLVDPATAPHVILDFEGVRTVLGGSGEIDKKYDSKLSHLLDGTGYYIEQEFPVGGKFETRYYHGGG